MRGRRIALYLLMIVCCVALSSTGVAATFEGSSTARQSATKRLTIGMVLPGPEPFWQLMRTGAQGAARKFPPSVRVLYVSGRNQNDAASRIAQLQAMRTRKVDAIIVPPRPELIPELNRAIGAGIKVFFVDGDMPFARKTSVIKTDTFKAGRLAGRFIRQRLGGKGDVAVTGYTIGLVPSFDARTLGAMAEFQGTGINVVAQVNTNCDTSMSVSVMQNVLTANPKLAAVFAPCAGAILGDIQAIKAARLSDQVLTVGFDASDGELELIRSGDQDATIAQFPRRMGSLAVSTALRSLQGKRVARVVDSGTALVTRENVDSFNK